MAQLKETFPVHSRGRVVCAVQDLRTEEKLSAQPTAVSCISPPTASAMEYLGRANIYQEESQRLRAQVRAPLGHTTSRKAADRI